MIPVSFSSSLACVPTQTPHSTSTPINPIMCLFNKPSQVSNKRGSGSEVCYDCLSCTRLFMSAELVSEMQLYISLDDPNCKDLESCTALQTWIFVLTPLSPQEFCVICLIFREGVFIDPDCVFLLLLFFPSQSREVSGYKWP